MSVSTHSSRTALKRRVVALLSALTLPLAALATPVTAQAEPAPEITWEACPPEVGIESAECGRIEVPREYSDPAGEKISVGFVRRPATGKSRGTLFTNPGGPGGPAYTFVGASTVPWPEAIISEWDIVGVQPRGLVGSTPMTCSDLPNVAGAFLTAGQVALECELTQPGLMRSLTTSNTADDWEMVRRALGLESISILGLSYGTYLGSVYASRYPHQVDRLILDSTFDVATGWAGVMHSQQAGFEQAYHDFFTYVAQNNERFQLGTTPLQVYNTFNEMVKAQSGTTTTVTPPPAQPEDLEGHLPDSSTQLSPAVIEFLNRTGKARAEALNLLNIAQNPLATTMTSGVSTVVQASLSTPMMWEETAQLISNVAHGRPVSGEPLDVEVSPDEVMEQMQKLLAALKTMQFMQTAVICNESPSTLYLEHYPGYLWDAFVSRDAHGAGLYRYSTNTICLGYQGSSSILPISGAELAVKPLQISGTRDPQTPYQGHRSMADAMGSHVLTVHGPGHGHVAAGNARVDEIAAEYLRSGVVSETDVPGIH